MIISWAKAFNTTVEHVLYDMSYLNCIMYTSATPLYDDEDGWDESLDANDPNNFNNNSDEEEFVR